MARKLVKTVQDRIDAVMASLAVWFMDAWTVVERSWRRPLSRLALRLKFAFYPLLACAALGWLGWDWSHDRSLDSAENSIFDTVKGQIEPFNKKGVSVTEATTFQGDLEWDSLTVMDFVAAIEDEFDIIITMNMQAEIETVGQLADAVAKLKN